MMKDSRMNIIYDFEGDDADIEENEWWLRRLHPIEEYPYFDVDYGDQADCWFEVGCPCRSAAGKFCHVDHTRLCRWTCSWKRTNRKKQKRKRRQKP